jgi:hypothetical protein
MATKNGAILSLLISAPCRVGALLHAFFLPTATRGFSRFQADIALVPLARRSVQRVLPAEVKANPNSRVSRLGLSNYCITHTCA